MKCSDHSYHKEVINRLATIQGHVGSVPRMVENERACDEILVQLAAVRAAINYVSRIVLKDHISGCVVEAVEKKDYKVIDKLNSAIDKILK